MKLFTSNFTMEMICLLMFPTKKLLDKRKTIEAHFNAPKKTSLNLTIFFRVRYIYMCLHLKNICFWHQLLL